MNQQNGASKIASDNKQKTGYQVKEEGGEEFHDANDQFFEQHIGDLVKSNEGGLLNLLQQFGIQQEEAKQVSAMLGVQANSYFPSQLRDIGSIEYGQRQSIDKKPPQAESTYNNRDSIDSDLKSIDDQENAYRKSLQYDIRNSSEHDFSPISPGNQYDLMTTYNNLQQQATMQHMDLDRLYEEGKKQAQKDKNFKANDNFKLAVLMKAMKGAEKKRDRYSHITNSTGQSLEKITSGEFR